jgi:hypothetical protein
MHRSQKRLGRFTRQAEIFRQLALKLTYDLVTAAGRSPVPLQNCRYVFGLGFIRSANAAR